MRTSRTAEGRVGKPCAASAGTGRNPGEDEGGAEGCPWMEANSDPQTQRLLERALESGNMKLELFVLSDYLGGLRTTSN